MTETRAPYTITTQRTLPITFFVPGLPRPKQSFRMRHDGRHFTDPAVKQWQNAVSDVASLAYKGAPSQGELHVVLTFALPDNRRRDADNLSKCVLDGCNGILWMDDTQVYHLEVVKLPGMPAADCGVTVEVAIYGEADVVESVKRRRRMAGKRTGRKLTRRAK
jgi:Holliday junction resolvase RusA-like endonuclease